MHMKDFIIPRKNCCGNITNLSDHRTQLNPEIQSVKISAPTQKHPDDVFTVQLINVFMPHYVLLSRTGQSDGLDSP